MDKRERILELVKEGVLSVAEGLDLLESLSKQEQEPVQADQAADVETKQETMATEPETKPEPEAEAETETKVETEQSEQAAAAEKMLADELEAIANEINEYSVTIDGLNEKILATNSERQSAEEKLTDKINSQNEAYFSKKQALEAQIIQLNKEMNQLTSIPELTSEEEINALQTKINEQIDALYTLENSTASEEEIAALEKQIQQLNEKSAQLTQEKNEKMKEMHSLKMRQWTTKAKQFSGSIDIPEEWRAGATKTIDKASEFIDESTQSLGSILREAANKTKQAFQEIDWEEMKIDLSGKEKAAISNEWLFEETTATILDFKNTNGQIRFKQSINDNIKIEAEIKMYELKEGQSPLQTFEEQATITIDADQFTFKVPEQRVVADLTIYLPARNYDYLRVESAKGDVHFDELLVRDIYVKLAAGNVLFKKLEASMLEVKVSKGDVTLQNVSLRDLLANTVNGNIRVQGSVHSLAAKTVHGDLLLTLTGQEMTRVIASSVKGDVKISLPQDVSFEIEAKTTLGQVKSRLTASEKTLEDQERGKVYRFFRMAEGNLCQVTLETTKGNVLLKDSDEKNEEREENEKTD